jgi:predicted transposase/invertase (TIGR01784 family)
MLNDEAQKIVLNTKGFMKDLSEELLEFLGYVENSTDSMAKSAKGNLVKSIHKRVQEVKNDISVEVEFMTLLERDREKIEEGREEGKIEGKIEVAKNLLDILDDETIAKKTGLSVEQIKKLRNNDNKN